MPGPFKPLALSGQDQPTGKESPGGEEGAASQSTGRSAAAGRGRTFASRPLRLLPVPVSAELGALVLRRFQPPPRLSAPGASLRRDAGSHGGSARAPPPGGRVSSKRSGSALWPQGAETLVHKEPTESPGLRETWTRSWGSPI